MPTLSHKRDAIVLQSTAVKLWETVSKPKTVWYNTRHYGAAPFIAAALKPAIEHFGAE